jgi:hypothetical protein
MGSRISAEAQEIGWITMRGARGHLGCVIQNKINFAGQENGQIMAFGPRGKTKRHAVDQNRRGHSANILDRRRISPLHQRPCAHRNHQGLRSTRPRTPSQMRRDLRGISRRVRATSAHQIKDHVTNPIPYGHVAHQILGRNQIGFGKDLG